MQCAGAISQRPEGEKVTKENGGQATAYYQWFWRGAPSLSLPAGPVDGTQFVKRSLTSNMAGSGARGGQ